MADPSPLVGEVVGGSPPQHHQPEVSMSDYIRMAGYFLEFLQVMGPAYLLGLIAWRISR